MEAKTFKNTILQKKLLRPSAWQKFLERNFYKVRKFFFKSEVKITHFNFKKWDNILVNNSLPPEKTGWEKRWYGYFEMEKAQSKEFKQFCEDVHGFEKGLTEEELEKQCLLSIINEIQDKNINFFELGAGFGRECLTLAGIVDFHLISSVKDKNYRCLALEAEPTHYDWLVEHFKKQNIKGEAVHGAVSDKSGHVFFDNSLDPANFYGQTIIEGERGCKVRSYTVDELTKKYNFSKVNIIHLDVQGNEYKTILGAQESIKEGLIDYWIIGTHEGYLGEKIIKKVKHFYDVILYIPHKSGFINHEFYGRVFIPQDGLLILKSKKLN